MEELEQIQEDQPEKELPIEIYEKEIKKIDKVATKLAEKTSLSEAIKFLRNKLNIEKLEEFAANLRILNKSLNKFTKTLKMLED